MSKEELLKSLDDCADMGIEEGHSRADELLLEFIDDPEISSAFNGLDRWYA